jgi:hypothetical protein
MKRITVTLLLAACIIGGASAQVQFSAGPGAGFSYAMHTSTDGAETNTHFGLSVTSQFDLQFSRLLGLLIWVDFHNDLSARRTEDGLTSELNISYLQLAPTLKFCIPGSPLYLFGGPGVGFKTRGRAGASYAGYSYEEDIPDMAVRLDARFGLGYDLFLSQRFTLSPFAAFNAALNDVIPDADWQIHALQAGIVLRYNF